MKGEEIGFQLVFQERNNKRKREKTVFAVFEKGREQSSFYFWIIQLPCMINFLMGRHLICYFYVQPGRRVGRHVGTRVQVSI